MSSALRSLHGQDVNLQIRDPCTLLLHPTAKQRRPACSVTSIDSGTISAAMLGSRMCPHHGGASTRGPGRHAAVCGISAPHHTISRCTASRRSNRRLQPQNRQVAACSTSGIDQDVASPQSPLEVWQRLSLLKRCAPTACARRACHNASSACYAYLNTFQGLYLFCPHPVHCWRTVCVRQLQAAAGGH